MTIHLYSYVSKYEEFPSKYDNHQSSNSPFQRLYLFESAGERNTSFHSYKLFKWYLLSIISTRSKRKRNKKIIILLVNTARYNYYKHIESLLLLRQFNCIANTFVRFSVRHFFVFLHLYIFDRIIEIMYRILHYKKDTGDLFIRKHVYKISSRNRKTRQTNHSSYIATYNANCGCRLQLLSDDN